MSTDLETSDYAGWTDKLPGEQYPETEDGAYRVSILSYIILYYTHRQC
jgi:hypothetical protein